MVWTTPTGLVVPVSTASAVIIAIQRIATAMTAVPTSLVSRSRRETGSIPPYTP